MQTSMKDGTPMTGKRASSHLTTATGSLDQHQEPVELEKSKLKEYWLLMTRTMSTLAQSM
jgi:hypothetical protein